MKYFLVYFYLFFVQYSGLAQLTYVEEELKNEGIFFKHTIDYQKIIKKNKVKTVSRSWVDSTGKIIDSAYSWNYEYDSNGRLIQEGIRAWKYDSLGKVIESTTYDQQLGVFAKDAIYTYDQHGKIVRLILFHNFIEYPGDSIHHKRYDFHYDNFYTREGVLIKRQELLNEKTRKIYTYTYNKKNNLTAYVITLCDSDSTIYRTILFKYDKLNRLIEESFDNYKTTLRYNKKNQIVDDGSHLIYYNKKGLISKMIYNGYYTHFHGQIYQFTYEFYK